jgi:hypothetical protein
VHACALAWLYWHELCRFELKYSIGTRRHEKLMNTIEVYGTRVAPLEREQLG